MDNCTVTYNICNTPTTSLSGAGIYNCTANNCIVFNNLDYTSPLPGLLETTLDNSSGGLSQLNYSCSSPIPSGGGNTNVTPQFLDLFHLATTSPCIGAGSPAYASGTDLDGQTWGSPPSMGCSEVVVSNLAGPLLAGISGYSTPQLPNRPLTFFSSFTGRATSTLWSFGDGQSATNAGLSLTHTYAQAGNYVVNFTVYNNSDPAGVSASTNLQVIPINMPPLQAVMAATNGFQFQFLGQNGVICTIQYATNLAPPITWKTLTTVFPTNGWYQVTDTTPPTGTRFYRVEAQ